MLDWRLSGDAAKFARSPGAAGSSQDAPASGRRPVETVRLASVAAVFSLRRCRAISAVGISPDADAP